MSEKLPITHMFDNYTESDSGLKYNLTKDFPPINGEIQLNPPYKSFDKYGNLISLKWNVNDKFILTDTLDLFLFVQFDSIIYEESGETPTPETFGQCCQLAYNTVDYKCWKCYGLVNRVYQWKEINPLVCINGTEKIKFIFNPTDTTVKIKILNFRQESIIEEEVTVDDSLWSLPISNEKYPQLLQGQYLLEVIISKKDETKTVKKIPLTIN